MHAAWWQPLKGGQPISSHLIIMKVLFQMFVFLGLGKHLPPDSPPILQPACSSEQGSPALDLACKVHHSSCMPLYSLVVVAAIAVGVVVGGGVVVCAAVFVLLVVAVVVVVVAVSVLVIRRC